MKRKISFDKLFVDDATPDDVKQCQSPPGPAAIMKTEPFSPSEVVHVRVPEQETPTSP